MLHRGQIEVECKGVFWVCYRSESCEPRGDYAKLGFTRQRKQSCSWSVHLSFLLRKLAKLSSRPSPRAGVLVKKRCAVTRGCTSPLLVVQAERATGWYPQFRAAWFVASCEQT